MRRIFAGIALLVGPLAGVALVAFVLYGIEGPPDTPRVNAAAQAIGATYGVYAVALIGRWIATTLRRSLR